MLLNFLKISAAWERDPINLGMSFNLSLVAATRNVKATRLQVEKKGLGLDPFSRKERYKYYKILITREVSPLAA